MTGEHPQDPARFPDGGFSAADFETPTQTILREGYQEALAANQLAIATFDPHSEETPYAELQLDSGFEEAEAAEPALADRHRDHMLRTLGAHQQELDDTDPALLFQYQFRDGFRQVRRLQRPDGTTVILNTYRFEDGAYQNATLTTEEQAQKDIAGYQEQVDEFWVVRQLAERLGANTDELLEQMKDTTLAEKRATLQELQRVQFQNNAQHGEDLLQGDEQLARARKRYAKAILPALGMLDGWRERKREQRVEEYAGSIMQNIVTRELSGNEAQKFIDQEQPRRHAALNRQLRLRTRVRLLGTAALSVTATTLLTGLGTALGEFHTRGMSTAEGVTGGAVLSAVTVGYMVRKVIERKRMLIPFNPMTTAHPHVPLEEQIDAEMHRADNNVVHLDGFNTL